MPPLLWFGVVYLGSLFALLANAFFRLDDFTGQVVREFTLEQLHRARRSRPTSTSRCARVTMAVLRHAGLRRCSASRSPTTWRATRAARQKALLYVAVMLPLWSSYLVRLYAWKLLLAKEGAISWLPRSSCISAGCSTRCCRLPVVGGTSLSFSPLGTFIVFVYMWLPFMILPIQAAIERIPGSLHRGVGRPGRRARARPSAA